MNVTIRQEQKSDYKEVYELNSSAFEEDEEARLVTLLRKSSAFIPSLSLVAIMKDTIVGHILFTKIKIVDENGNENESLALAPMAVSPKFQKSGIGSQLIKTGLDIAREMNFKSVIVLGHDKYYPRFGFEPTTKWNITSPYDVPSNFFMGLELIQDGLKNSSGMVQYAKEFDEV